MNIKLTHMWSEPDNWMKRRLLAGVDGFVDGWEVRVLEECAPVPTESFDMLVVGLLKPAL